MPTLGENFGHVILEALCGGTPVLLSNQTPWLHLEEKGIGWDVPLDDAEGFKKNLQKCIDMDYGNYIIWSEAARKYGLNLAKDVDAIEKNRSMFNECQL